jgi:hypothetical protein
MDQGVEEECVLLIELILLLAVHQVQELQLEFKFQQELFQ